MKKNYLWIGAFCLMLFSNQARSQNKLSEQDMQPIFDKLELLSKQNPAGAYPLDKLSREEYNLYIDYQNQKKAEINNPYGITDAELKVKVSKAKVQPILDKINNLPTSAERFPEEKFTREELKLLRIYELQNVKNVSNRAAALNTAYALNLRLASRPYGTTPLSSPHVFSQISTLTSTYYSDDIAGDGKVYALNNDTRFLDRIDGDGNAVPVVALSGIPSGDILTGLSWNAATNTMYVIATANLYTLNMSTGVATLVGAIGGVTTPIWLEIDNAGNAFTLDISDDSIYSVNLSTGVATLIGPTGVSMNFAQDADFNRETNELYMASYTGSGVGGIYKIDTSTGAASLVADTTPNNAEYTMFSITNSLIPPFTKAFVKNSYTANPVVFGSIPLVPPHTVTTIAPLAGNLYADDMASDGNLYVIDNVSKNLLKMYSDGSTRIVGPTSVVATDTVTGLSWNNANSTMYLISVGASTKTLYTVNLTTGAATIVADITGATLPIWLEIDSGGNAYVADSETDNLLSLNLSTGVCTVIGSLGINIQFAQEADFNNDDTLYMAGYIGGGTSNIYTVDKNTGLATALGATTGNEFTLFTIADTLPPPPPIPPITCGDTFVDSGGASANYANNENITYRFAPVNVGDAVTITFTAVDIEATATGAGVLNGCYDYLTIYNGPSTSSPVLAASKCGSPTVVPSVAASNLVPGDSFTSTDPTGELIVTFKSDNIVPKAGWQATVSCAALAVDQAHGDSLAFYPNPTTGILNITAGNSIDKVEVYNMVGQQVLTLMPKSKKSEINMSSLKPGVYMVKALVNGKTVINKVIKK